MRCTQSLRHALISCSVNRHLSNATNITQYSQQIVQNFKSSYNDEEYSPLRWLAKSMEDIVVAKAYEKYKSNEKNQKFKILDVACGVGSYLRRIRSLNISDHILGIDLSNDIINEAKQFDKKYGIDDIEYIQLDARELISCTKLHEKFDIANASWFFDYATSKEFITYGQ